MEVLVFFVNGKKIVERNVDPEQTLVWYLRNRLRLVGTKVACGQGGCGACTVMVSERAGSTKCIRHYTVMACLVPLCTLHGKAVTTVEGIGNTRTKLHPVQERLAKTHGVQCGFCSPGMVMSIYTLLRNKPEPSLEQIQTALQGNLCRCTGYRPILAAAATFTKECCSQGADCCRNKKTNEYGNIFHSPTFDQTTFSSYDKTQDLIFPTELLLSDYSSQSCTFKGANVTYFQPANLQEAFDILQQYPRARVVGGCTAIAHELQKGAVPAIVSLANIHELRLTTPEEMIRKNGEVIFGANLTISDFQEEINKVIERFEAPMTKSLKAISEVLDRIGASQIRNVGTVGGNVGSGRSSHDLATWLSAVGCRMNIISRDSSRLVPLDMELYADGTTALRVGEIIGDIRIPLSNQDQHYSTYKHSRRSGFDWSVVSAGFGLHFEAGTTTVKQLTITFGSLGYPVFLAKRASAVAVGRVWNESLLADLQRELSTEISGVAHATGEAVSEFKKTLASGFLQKFFSEVMAERQTAGRQATEDDRPSSVSGLKNGPVRATHVLEEVPEGQALSDAVGRPVIHQSAFESTTGQARYVDDIPKYENEVHVAPVLSTKAHAKILSVDPSAALGLPGVVCYIDHNDVPGVNIYGSIKKDTRVFATDKVTCEGNTIGAIVAEDSLTARKAANMVKVSYEDLEPILSIEEAMAAAPDTEPEFQLHTGDVDAGFRSADHVLEGEIRSGSQEHFYMETMAGIVVPRGEHQEYEMVATTQAPLATHNWVAEILGVDRNRIDLKIKRIGGAFGGKETLQMRALGPSAVAAHKLQRPARCVLTREEDMLMTGKRHPALFKYKVGFSKEGKLIALDLAVHANGGDGMDLSPAVLDQILLNVDIYKIPNYRCKGHVWYTNTQTATSFRGFGIPQAAFCMENIIHDISQRLGVPQEKIRQANLMKEGDATVTGTVLKNCTSERCWQTCLEQSNYSTARQQIEMFNRGNKWKKRGIAMTSVRFPVISVRPTFMMQADALVNVYMDGTVLINHGGIEMGQGLFTKIIQIASRALNIPTQLIHVRELSTATIPNPFTSCGSQSTDMFGGAVKDACEKLLTKLQPYKDKYPDKSWKDWTLAAYMDQVSLSTSGFWKSTNVDFDWSTGKGDICEYYTYATGCSQVEVDCLTGDHKILKVDLVFDVGRSLNPAIDIGQIEGGFMMGYGWMTMEENVHTSEGKLLTKGPHTYKIPTINTTPEEFNVTLLKGAVNPCPAAMYSAKGIGEPPLLLSMSAFLAIKEAILAKRKDSGLTEMFRLDAPATSEKIRMACGDKLISKA